MPDKQSESQVWQGCGGKTELGKKKKKGRQMDKTEGAQNFQEPN